MTNTIYQTLSKIDVTRQTKSKNGSTYLPWASCWAIVMEHFPESTYKTHTQKITVTTENKIYDIERPWFSDGTGWVEVEVEIVQRSDTDPNDVCYKRHTETYPIMDYRNQAIAEENITTTDVNKATKRALVKAVATCTGLGLHLFYGEDLPMELSEISDLQNRVFEIAKKKSGLSDKTKEKVSKLLKAAEQQTNPDLDEESITGRVTNINDADVLRELEKKLLAIRKTGD